MQNMLQIIIYSFGEVCPFMLLYLLVSSAVLKAIGVHE